MRPELFGDRVGLGDSELGHVTPLRAAIGKCASDVDMEVGHGLVILTSPDQTSRIEPQAPAGTRALEARATAHTTRAP